MLARRSPRTTKERRRVGRCEIRRIERHLVVGEKLRDIDPRRPVAIDRERVVGPAPREVGATRRRIATGQPGRLVHRHHLLADAVQAHAKALRIRGHVQHEAAAAGHTRALGVAAYHTLDLDQATGPGALRLRTRYGGIASACIGVARKVARASAGDSTIGSSLPLNDVLSNTGTPVR
jgi:hypothetical protein